MSATVGERVCNNDDERDRARLRTSFSSRAISERKSSTSAAVAGGGGGTGGGGTGGTGGSLEGGGVHRAKGSSNLHDFVCHLCQRRQVSTLGGRGKDHSDTLGQPLQE